MLLLINVWVKSAERGGKPAKVSESGTWGSPRFAEGRVEMEGFTEEKTKTRGVR